MNKYYNAIYNLFYSLNSDFLDSLKKYSLRNSNKSLQTLIREYSRKATPETLIYIEALNNDDCITSQLDYLDFIDYMTTHTK